MASRLYHWLLVAFLISGIVNLAIELSSCSGQAMVKLVLVVVLKNLWSSVLFNAKSFVETVCGHSSNVNASCNIGFIARFLQRVNADVFFVKKTSCLHR